MATEAQVFEYWEAESCGTFRAKSTPGTREYYDEIESARYELEPFIHDFAAFPTWRGKRVLEIGVGAATDFLNFARGGAVLTGVDLTPAAVEHARRRLELEQLEADVRVGSGEDLPFEDGSFDLVYSWGVIHHAEHPARIIREVRRLIAPAGQARIMLYGRHSWLAYRLWLRHALLAGRPGRSISDVISTHMESPGTQAYTRREVELLFAGAGFDDVTVRGFPTPYDRSAAGPLARLIRLDWFLGIVAT